VSAGADPPIKSDAPGSKVRKGPPDARGDHAGRPALEFSRVIRYGKSESEFRFAVIAAQRAGTGHSSIAFRIWSGYG